MGSKAGRRLSSLPSPAPRRSGGFTLIELMVAISLATISAVYIFSSYIDVVRGFHFQAKRAERVRDMVLAKTKIVKALLDAGSLTLISPDKCTFSRTGDSLAHTVEFRAGALLRDGTPVQKNLTAFSFRPSDAITADGRRVIRWEGTLGCGAWIGGVFVATDAVLTSVTGW